MPSYTSPIPFGRALRAVAVPFLVSRAGVLLAGLTAVMLFGEDPARNPSATWRVASDPLRNLFARWDTFWYLDIAQRGYQWNGNPLEQQNVVFFPLLPALLHAGGSSALQRLWIGVVVALTACAAALAYVWRWTAERRDEATATTTVALIAAFPFAVFFSAVYTESLFLLATAGAWYHAEHRDVSSASAFGVAAGLLRPNGFLLAAPLAWLMFVPSRVQRTRLNPWPSALIVAAPIAGMLLHSAYLAATVGDAWAWIRGQAAWSTVAPWGDLRLGPATPFDWTVIAIHAANAATLLLAAASLRPAARLLGGASAILIAISLAPPLLRHGLQSLGRFTSVLFPMFVWLAIAVPAHRRRWLIAIFAAGQAVAAAWFFTWRPLV